jgi:signal peptidase
VSTAARVGRLVIRALPKVLGIVLLAVFVAYAAPQVVGAQGSYVVLSGSMEPAISTGDVVFVYETNPAEISEGDVITYRRGETETPITHRVVEVVERPGEGPAFRTKGDANQDPDPSPVPASNVLGRVPVVSIPILGTVLVRIPRMGYVVQFAGTGYGYVTLIAAPIVLLVASEIWSLARSRRSESDDPDDSAPAATGDDRPGRIAPTDPETTDDDEGSHTVNATDLTMTTGALVLLAVYSGYMAYRTQSPVSVSIAVAAVGCAALFTGLKYASSRSSRTTVRPAPDRNRRVPLQTPTVLRPETRRTLRNGADRSASTPPTFPGPGPSPGGVTTTPRRPAPPGRRGETNPSISIPPASSGPGSSPGSATMDATGRQATRASDRGHGTRPRGLTWTRRTPGGGVIPVTDRAARRVALLIGLLVVLLVGGGATTSSVLSDTEDINATFSVGNVTVSADTVGSSDATPTVTPTPTQSPSAIERPPVPDAGPRPTG